MNAAQIAAAFEKYPHATLIFTDFGHAYGKAKFDSVCALTGLEIRTHEPIRKVSVVTRQGREWSGYISNRSLDLLNARMMEDATFATFKRCCGDWLTDALQGADEGDKLAVVLRNGTQRRYVLRASGCWRLEGTMTDATEKQMRARLKAAAVYSRS